MTDSTNPRVMADNIKELSASSGSQAADISDLQEDVGTLQTIVGALGTYSTTEYDTGKKWIDDRAIYGKVITFEEDFAISYGTYTNTSIDITNVDLILSCNGTSSSEGYFNLLAVKSSNTLRVQIQRNGQTNANVQVIIFEYVKVAPAPTPDVSPSPDLDTRALEEPETEVEPEPIEEKK